MTLPKFKSIETTPYGICAEVLTEWPRDQVAGKFIELDGDRVYVVGCEVHMLGSPLKPGEKVNLIIMEEQ